MSPITALTKSQFLEDVCQVGKEFNNGIILQSNAELQLIEGRKYASSVVLNETRLWVSGGYDEKVNPMHHTIHQEANFRNFCCGKQSLADQKIKIGVQANKKIRKIKKKILPIL